MAVYFARASNQAFSTSDDIMTITSASSRRTRILEVILSGMGTTSAANSLAVQRSSAGTTANALTPEKAVTDTAAYAGTVAVATTSTNAWSTDPTLAGTPMLVLGCNANGGIMRWVAAPGEEIEARNGEQISFRPVVGTSNMNLTVVFEEL